MSRLSRIILGYLVSFLFIVIPAKAQKEAEVYNVDSSLYAYYQRCQLTFAGTGRAEYVRYAVPYG